MLISERWGTKVVKHLEKHLGDKAMHHCLSRVARLFCGVHDYDTVLLKKDTISFAGRMCSHLNGLFCVVVWCKTLVGKRSRSIRFSGGNTII